MPTAAMRVLSACRIDCAGVLKLRNSDIELRKGETDIGRKNTRVRLVFRVHIPQPDGRTLSLQVASNPIECCEWPPRQGQPPACGRERSLPRATPPSCSSVCVACGLCLPVTHVSLSSHGHSGSALGKVKRKVRSVAKHRHPQGPRTGDVTVRPLPSQKAWESGTGIAACGVEHVTRDPLAWHPLSPGWVGGLLIPM